MISNRGIMQRAVIRRHGGYSHAGIFRQIILTRVRSLQCSARDGEYHASARASTAIPAYLSPPRTRTRFFFYMRHGSSGSQPRVRNNHERFKANIVSSADLSRGSARCGMGINLHNVYTRTATRNNHATQRSVHGQLISSARYIHGVCPNIWPTCPPSIDIALAI